MFENLVTTKNNKRAEVIKLIWVQVIKNKKDICETYYGVLLY